MYPTFATKLGKISQHGLSQVGYFRLGYQLNQEKNEIFFSNVAKKGMSGQK